MCHVDHKWMHSLWNLFLRLGSKALKTAMSQLRSHPDPETWSQFHKVISCECSKKLDRLTIEKRCSPLTKRFSFMVLLMKLTFKDQENRRNLLLLSVAYAAGMGGTGVVTGNPSNLVILEVLFSYRVIHQWRHLRGSFQLPHSWLVLSFLTQNYAGLYNIN